MYIIIATNNQNKVKEIRHIVNDDSIEFFSLKDLGLKSDPDETGSTFLDNAIIKAESALKAMKDAGLSDYCIVADDSGLCVDALDGAPGVYSARYAQVEGQDCSYSDNNKKLLSSLSDVKYDDRCAHFETVALLINEDSSRRSYTGKLFGHIAFEELGEYGFGYDPIFIPDIIAPGVSNNLKKTLAQLNPNEKDAISHRSQAFRGLFN